MTTKTETSDDSHTRKRKPVKLEMVVKKKPNDGRELKKLNKDTYGLRCSLTGSTGSALTGLTGSSLLQNSGMNFFIHGIGICDGNDKDKRKQQQQP